ncbi:MAG TPA: hypothetical protein VN947_29770 [Polyangia bacterium]|nr:hypothetical protein [Polyangia bacterium]
MTRTPTAEIALRDEGIVVTRIEAGVQQSLADARVNLAATVDACARQKRPLLVDISRCLPLEPEVRHYYTGEVLLASFLALALVVEATPFGRMMGNIYLRVARPGVPTRLFPDEPSALTWLRTFLS